MERITDEEVRILRLDKGNERYIFVYTKDHKTDMLHTLCRWATNQELSFSWYDAVRLATKIRNW